MEDKLTGMTSTSLRKAIRQEQPFASPQVEALLTLMRATDRVGERVERPFAEAGISGAQYNVLRILRGAGESGIQTYDVAERLVKRAPNITRLVDKLEAKDLLRRKRCDKDRRVVWLFLTPAGAELLDGLDAPLTQATHEAMAALSANELRELTGLLNKLRIPLEDA